jgi:isopenicillin N synthase-like dioxygenase
MISDCFGEARNFFQQPLVKKQLFSCAAPTSIGYSLRQRGAYRNTGTDGQYTNEMLDVPPPIKQSPHFGVDFFPIKQRVFAETCAKCHREHRRVEVQLLKLYSIALERVSGKPLGSSYLRRMQARHRGLLRLNYYPDNAGKSNHDDLINGEHTDWSSLTILSPSGAGLESSVGGQWIPVPFVEGLSYVLVGEQLHRWSNGIFKPAVHRVTVSGAKGRTRQSLAYFATEHVDMNDSSTISPVCAMGAGAKFSPLSIRDFLTSRFSELKAK